MTILKDSKADVLSLRLNQKIFRAIPIDTAERDLIDAENGMIIYNGQTEKFQGYENGAWVDFI